MSENRSSVSEKDNIFHSQSDYFMKMTICIHLSYAKKLKVPYDANKTVVFGRGYIILVLSPH